MKTELIHSLTDTFEGHAQQTESAFAQALELQSRIAQNAASLLT